MAGNNGGPWGGSGSGGGNRGRGGGGGRDDGPRRPGGGDQQIPEIDEIVRKGQEQLRVLMGGRGGRTGGGGTGGPGAPSGRMIGLVVAAVALMLWLYQSFYTVRPEEQSVELFLGEFQRGACHASSSALGPCATVTLCGGWASASRCSSTSARSSAAGYSRRW